MKKIIAIFWMPAMLLIINFTPFARNLYDTTTWFDDIMHTLGGAAIALMLYTYMNLVCSSWWKPVPRYAKIGFAISVAALFGVMWEWYEFISDTFFATHHQPNMPDTMNDLFLACVGALIFSCLYLAYRKK